MTTLMSYTEGVRAFEARNYAGAVQHFVDILKVEPANLEVREYLARAHYHRAALGPAEQELRTLLATDPTNEYATLMLARTLERQSRHDEAAGVRRLLVALTGDERHLDEHRLA